MVCLCSLIFLRTFYRQELLQASYFCFALWLFLTDELKKKQDPVSIRPA